jgi:hypothetical protein
MGAHGFRAERQVLWHRPNQWIIFDTITAPPGQQAVIPWHFSPQLKADDNQSESFWTFSDGTQADAMQVRIRGSEGISTRLFKGSKEPFQGWTYQDGYLPAPTIEVRHAGPDLWLTTWLSLTPQSKALSNGHVRMMQVNRTGDAHQWSLVLPCSEGNISVERTPEAVHVIDANCTPGSSEYRLDLLEQNDISRYQKEYLSLKATLINKYPTYQPTIGRLVKLTSAVVTAWLMQEFARLLFLWKQWFRMIILLRVVSCIVLLVSITWYLIVYKEVLT